MSRYDNMVCVKCKYSGLRRNFQIPNVDILKCPECYSEDIQSLDLMIDFIKVLRTSYKHGEPIDKLVNQYIGGLCPQGE